MTFTKAQILEAVRRLAILCEWNMHQPVQHWCPEAKDYDVEKLVSDLLDEKRLMETVQDSGKGLDQSAWFVEALLGKQ